MFKNHQQFNKLVSIKYLYNYIIYIYNMYSLYYKHATFLENYILFSMLIKFVLKSIHFTIYCGCWQKHATHISIQMFSFSCPHPPRKCFQCTDGRFLAKTAYTQLTRWAKNQKNRYYKIEHLKKLEHCRNCYTPVFIIFKMHNSNILLLLYLFLN